ncbi:MAG: hypothetical protein EXQ94_09585 [Alphaproteobacteria bacterium]|nr:hypothetical protein [Alphaproteobacteria bacterium]
MRRIAAVAVLVILALVPSTEPKRWAAAWSELAAIAPGAGPLLDLRLGLDLPPASRGSPYDDGFASGTSSWGLAIAGALCVVAGFVLGSAVRRRRRGADAAHAMPEASEEGGPTPPIVSPASRPVANALAQSLAAIDMMEIEVRTSLRHLGKSVEVLADGIVHSPMGSREPALKAGDAQDALAEVEARFAQLRTGWADHEVRIAEARTAAESAMTRIQSVVRLAESMDSAFQMMVASAEEISWLPRLFDELELRARPEASGESIALAIARARQIALGRIDGLLNARDALTLGIVAVEESLVSLDEAGPQLVNAAALRAGGSGLLGARIEDCDQSVSRLRGVLDELQELLAPLDAHAARLRAEAGETGQIVAQTITRMDAILGSFIRVEERRRFQRMNMAIPARVLIEDRWHDCQVMNLSMGGAAIDRALPCRVGASGQLSFLGWDAMIPLVVTGAGAGRTHLCFQLNDTLSKGLIGYVDGMLAA